MRMTIVTQALVAAVSAAVFLSAAPAANAAEIDVAKAAADLREQLKRDSDASAAIAKNQLDIANGEASTRAALAKAQVEAEKARSDYYQSLIPDPSKYKVATPGAPKLNARAARMSFEETEAAARQVVVELRKAAPAEFNKEGKCQAVWIFPGSSATAARSLIATSLSTERTLKHLESQLSSSRDDLGEVVDELPDSGDAKAFSEAIKALAAGKGGATMYWLPAAAPVVAAAIQGVLSIATIVKPQFAFDTSNQSATSTSVLDAKVFGAMNSGCYAVVDLNALLPNPDFSKELPRELALVEAVRHEVADARADVRSALRKAQAAKRDADKLRGNKSKKPEVDARDAYTEHVLAAAKILTDLTNDAEKALLALYAVDAQGTSALDAAVRGGMLRRQLPERGDFVYFVTLRTVASDVDLATKDGLFVKAATSLASNTIVSWQMSNALGRVVSAGSVDLYGPTEIRPVWPD